MATSPNLEANCPFPAPPEFAILYTPENVAAFNEGRGGAILPPPPVPTKFTVFNEEVDLEAVNNFDLLKLF